MSFFNLDDTPILAASGVTLNTEERATLASSLVCLRDAENFHTVALWGKILGIQKDYLIAQALKGDDLFNKKWFYRYGFTAFLLTIFGFARNKRYRAMAHKRIRRKDLDSSR